MSDKSSPLHDLLQNTWQGCISLREWICRPISIILRSLPIHGHHNKKIGNLIAHFTKDSSSMDIIEIDSSDTEDDFEDFGPPNRPNNVESQEVLPLSTEKPYYAPEIGTASTSEHVQRSLPPYFQNNIHKPVLKDSLQTSGRPILASRTQDYTRLEDDAEIINVNSKHRTLPSSFTNGNSRPKFSAATRHIDDFQADSMQRFPPFRNTALSRVPIGTKNSGTLNLRHSAHGTSGTGSLQNFPALPFSNGYSTDFSTLASSETRGKSHFHAETSYSNRENAFGPPLFTTGKFEPMPKSSTDSTDNSHIYGNVGTHRVLPSSLMPGKFHSQPLSGIDVQKHFGPGDDKRHEHDERAIYQEALQNLGQPRLQEDLPEGLLSVTLLKHQKIALAWMVQKEKSVHCTGGILADDQGLGKTISMLALIQKQMPQQSKFTVDDSNITKSEALNLDDDDDDMVNEMDKTKSLIEDNDRKGKPAACRSNNSKPAAGTLVVCPASVLQQWARELDEKVSENAKLKVLVYHGGSRTKSPIELAKYDVVVTTYAIVTNEVPKQSVDDDEGDQKKHEKYASTSEFSSSKKRKQADNGRKKAKKKGKGLKDAFMDLDSGPLARVRWFRVILDEAQTIKNHRTQVAKACCGLRAKRRWCLSGTPIQNAIDDLYSYFRFLKYEPYAIYSSFCTSIKHPISRNASQGYKKLQAILRAVLLRRTKGTMIDGEPILKLPPKTIRLDRVDFSKEERVFYMKLESESRQQFKEYAAAGTVKQNYANILLMLLRLRQACDHPQLVSKSNSRSSVKDSLDMAKQLPRDMLMNLLNLLEGSLAICGVCSDPPEDAVVTMCGHVFCYQCVSECLTSDENSCPVTGCGNTLGTDLVFSKTTLKSVSDDFYGETSTSSGLDEESQQILITNNAYISSKIKATLDILMTMSALGSEAFFEEENLFGCSNPNAPAKAIVFSQWTSMLDLLELSLNHALIQYRRLDGTMSLISRDRAVKDFNTDPEVTVMLMSLKAGSLGLNMVAACHVILLDLWWNPTTEDQAVDRAHRIGQTRPVTVSRLTVKDTVEDRILALQEEKRNMVSSAFGEQSGGHTSRLTVEDLRYLFRVDEDD